MPVGICKQVVLIWSLWVVRFMTLLWRGIANAVYHTSLAVWFLLWTFAAGSKTVTYDFYFAVDTACPPQLSFLGRCVRSPLLYLPLSLSLFLVARLLTSSFALIDRRTLGLTSPARSSTAKSPMRGRLWEGSSTHDAWLWSYATAPRGKEGSEDGLSQCSFVKSCHVRAKALLLDFLQVCFWRVFFWRTGQTRQTKRVSLVCILCTFRGNYECGDMFNSSSSVWFVICVGVLVSFQVPIGSLSCEWYYYMLRWAAG